MGVIVANKETFAAHIGYATDKAEKSIVALGKLMPNVGGPTGRTTKILLNGEANSIILYRTPMWYKACEIAKHKKRLLSVQRNSLLRITCVYRTISTMTLQVIASEPSIDLLAQKKGLLLERSKQEKITTIISQQERTWLLRRWQMRWRNEPGPGY